ncbi:MAG: protoporphyrinogen/coproporphyrinogen oxidase [Planctomycetota bacterium]
MGGGLAGLSAAYHSGFPIYEQRNRPGGISDSICKNGFVFDFGIHVLHSKDQRFLDLVEEVGVKLVSRQRQAWIYSYGSYTCYPFQVNSSHLPLLLRMRCVLNFLLRKRNFTARNYEEWMIQNFGKGFATTFLIPYAEKFWRVSPREMAYDWTDARVPQPSVKEVVRGAFVDTRSDLGPNAEFQYPSEPGAGFAGLARAIASKIENIHYGMKASAIDAKKKKVFFNGGEKAMDYDNLISTLPLPDLIELIADMPSEVREAGDKLSHNSIAIVNIGLDAADITDKHWIHFPEDDISFFRISFPDNFCDGLKPEGTSLIQTEVAYDKDNPPKRDKLLKTVREDLIRVGVIEPTHRVLFEDVIYVKYGYVVYDHHRQQAVQRIHECLNSLNIYPCGRYGSWKYLWTDEAILDGQAAVEKVLGKLEDRASVGS